MVDEELKAEGTFGCAEEQIDEAQVGAFLGANSPVMCGTIGDRQENKDFEPNDNWLHRSKNMQCDTCMWYLEKEELGSSGCISDQIGRCRKHSPTLDGWPVMFGTDWCGDHKLDENGGNR